MASNLHYSLPKQHYSNKVAIDTYTPNNSIPAQTVTMATTADAAMNFDTTPTPSYKPIANNTTNNRKEMYYPQENDSWVVSSQNSASGYRNDSAKPSSDPSSSSTGGIDDEMQQRHMQQLFDKKRRRRESHNAVERRRRDNINERIFELSTLLPERDASKNNKGTILRKSVDHIRLLHDKVNQYQQRVQELESMLEMYRMRWGDLNNNGGSAMDLSGIQPHLSNNNTHGAYPRDQ